MGYTQEEKAMTVEKQLEGIAEGVKNFKKQAAENRKDIDNLLASSRNGRGQIAGIAGKASGLSGHLRQKQTDLVKLTEGGPKVRIKAATTMDTSIFGDGVLQGLRQPGVVFSPDREPRLIDIISVVLGGRNSNPYSLIEHVVGEGGAAVTAEGATKPLMDWDYTEKTVNAVTIAVTAILSKQSLLSFSVFESDVYNTLMADLQDALEDQLLSGSGADGQMTGIQTIAKTFTGSDLAGTMTAPNNYDVLRAAVLQVRKGDTSLAGKTGFRASHVLLNPSDIAQLEVTKDGNGNYIKPAWGDTSSIAGVRIVSSDFITAGDFLVGRFDKFTYNTVEPPILEFGTIDKQFVNNQITARAELFGMPICAAQNAFAFVKGSFSSAKTALTDSGV